MGKVSTNWKTLSKKNLVSNKYINLWEEQVERPDGNMSTYYVFRREPFSIVIPYEDGKVILTKQYRYAINTITLEFPMGFAEGKSPYDTAETELREEAGITAAQLTEVGNFWVGSGKTDQVAYVYLAENLIHGEQELEDGEFIELERYSIDEVGAMIRRGEMRDGPSIVAYHYLVDYLKEHQS